MRKSKGIRDIIDLYTNTNKSETIEFDPTRNFTPGGLNYENHYNDQEKDK